MLDYKILFSYLQLWRSYAILSVTTIICSKCPPSAKTHSGWSHLIWHNFVTVVDKWIKFCILAYIGMCNRHVKFGLKIPNSLGKKRQKMPSCVLTDGGHFALTMWTRWSCLIWHNFIKVNWVKNLYSIVGRNVQQTRKIWSKNSQPSRKNARKPQGATFFWLTL